MSIRRCRTSAFEVRPVVRPAPRSGGRRARGYWCWPALIGGAGSHDVGRRCCPLRRAALQRLRLVSTRGLTAHSLVGSGCSNGPESKRQDVEDKEAM